MSFARCEICEGWGESDHHKCPPAWQVVEISNEIERTVYAADAESAAERYRELDSEDYESGDDIEVSVRMVSDVGAEWHHFDVSREYEPTYRATSRDNPPDGWEELGEGNVIVRFEVDFSDILKGFDMGRNLYEVLIKICDLAPEATQGVHKFRDSLMYMAPEEHSPTHWNMASRLLTDVDWPDDATRHASLVIFSGATS